MTPSFFLIQLLCSAFDCEHQRAGQITGPLPQQPQAREGRTNKLFNSDVPPLVNTLSGTVEGYKGKVMNGRDIFSFEGIPFAEPPIGNLRFRDPVPKHSWNGIRQAKRTSPICLQLRGLTRGREDCLYLNVYTPKLPVDGNGTVGLPVIVWIHGGSFLAGSGSDYGPHYLLRRDLILVTINYRLGVLGFMSTGDDVSSGNYGLKDQALAINWVSKNIESFGGDSNRICLMGQSAGAASVHFQMISTTSVARGLFHTAVSFSGSAFSNWALQTPTYARRLTTKLAKSFNCPTESGSEAIVDCFLKMDANVLVSAQPRLFFGWLANPLFRGEYPPIMRKLIDEKSKAEGRNSSRLPSFSASWVKESIGIHLQCIQFNSSNMK